jgi:1,4-dihydroxy-2-naphthoyl-CoA synthase
MTAVHHHRRPPITLRNEGPYERRGAAWEFSTDTSLIQVTVDQLGVALLKINQRETKNALSQNLIDSLISAFAMVERDMKVKVVVLTGSRTAGPFSGTYRDRMPKSGMKVLTYLQQLAQIRIIQKNI